MKPWAEERGREQIKGKEVRVIEIYTILRSVFLNQWTAI